MATDRQTVCLYYICSGLGIRKKRSWRKFGKKRGASTMDIHNFKLNRVFQDNAKEYQTRPVTAAKYHPGMENGWMVYFANKATKEKNIMTHEGVRFFSTRAEAWNYINADDKQYIRKNSELVETAVEYDPPKPVLYRKDDDAINKSGMHFCFGEYAFVSDESCDYEFYIMEPDCWIIKEIDGCIRVWYPDSEETFFGKDKEIVFERLAGREEYIKIAV